MEKTIPTKEITTTTSSSTTSSSTTSSSTTTRSSKDLSSPTEPPTEPPTETPTEPPTTLDFSKGSYHEIPDFLNEETCRVVQTISFSQNHLRHVSFRFPLHQLTSLSLGVNNLTCFPEITCCPNLRKLYLNNNFITAIDVNLLEQVPKLQVLDLRQNRIEKMKFPDAMCHLQWLSLSGNLLQEIQYFPVMEELHTFCFFGNTQLSQQQCISILQKMQHVETLFAGGTGLMDIPTPTTVQKQLIQSLLPKLTYLDGQYILSS